MTFAQAIDNFIAAQDRDARRTAAIRDDATGSFRFAAAAGARAAQLNQLDYDQRFTKIDGREG